MKTFKYYVTDVFTDHLFGGNPLAVFPDAAGIPEEAMQKIAREFNLSETTFVLPPSAPGADYKVRIFTPARELPMAGHPTIGTAFILKAIGEIAKEKSSVVFEEGVGNIPVDFITDENGQDIIQMTQPLPVFKEEYHDRQKLAALLSLEENDIAEGLPCQVVSCGVPFFYIPLKTLAAVEKATVRLDLYNSYLSNFASQAIFIFTTETVHISSSVHSRMFAPCFGIPEDPATGGAAGPLGSYLAKYDVLTKERLRHFINEQGFEMGRPSLIHILIEAKEQSISSVKIGGTSVLVAEGNFFLNT